MFKHATGLGKLPALTSSTSLCVWIAFIVVALFCFAVAAGLLRGDNWARLTGIVLAVILLFHIPMGTIIGVVILIYMFQSDVMLYFV